MFTLRNRFHTHRNTHTHAHRPHRQPERCTLPRCSHVSLAVEVTHPVYDSKTFVMGRQIRLEGWPKRHVCVFHGLIRAAVYSHCCSRDRGCTSRLSVSACQRVKPACENIYKTHLPLVRCYKWLPCGVLINKLVYLLEHNKLATNTDKESKNYKYCYVMKSLNVPQVVYEGPSPFWLFYVVGGISFDYFPLSHAALLNRWGAQWHSH